MCIGKFTYPIPLEIDMSIPSFVDNMNLVILKNCAYVMSRYLEQTDVPSTSSKRFLGK